MLFLLGAIVPFVALVAIGGALTQGSGDSLGRLDMPGKKKVTLEPGEVTLHFEEGRDYPDDETMDAPSRFDVAVYDHAGRTVQLHGASGSVAEGSGWSRMAMASFDVKERATYTVVAGDPPSGRPDPAVTLGEDGWDVFKPWLLRAVIGTVAGIALAAAVSAGLALRDRA